MATLLTVETIVMLHAERGSSTDSRDKEAPAAVGEKPYPPPARSHAERLSIAAAIGYPGGALLTCGQIERGLIALLDWEM